MKVNGNKILLIVCAALSFNLSADEVAPIEKSLDGKSPLNRENRSQSFFWKLGPQISWLSATSKSSTQYQVSTINASSKVIPGITSEIGIHIKKNANAFVFTDMSNVTFNEDADQTLSKKTFQRLTFGLGARYRLSDVSRLEVRFGFYDEFYLTTPKSKIVDIEKVKIPELQWSYRHAFGQVKGFDLNSAISSKLIIPHNSSNTKGELGYGVGGDLSLSYKNKEIKFFYNTSIVEAQDKSTNVHELGWSLIFKGKFFE